MNPYPDRITELHEWLAAKYGQQDAQATEVLLAALLPSSLTRTLRPWVIIETDFPSRDTSDAWFSFGSRSLNARSLAVPRLQRAPITDDILQRWIAERRTGSAGLFVESEWRRLPGGKLLEQHHAWRTFYSMCIRLRVAHPRGAHALMFDREADRMELDRLTRRILDSSLRTVSQQAAAAEAVPAGLLYWCELLQKTAPLQQDWETLIASIAAIARGIALLYSDGRSPAWDAAERVMRDTVPWLTAEILKHVEREPDRRGMRPWTYFKQSNAQRDMAQITGEMRRLQAEGVLVGQNQRRQDSWRYHPWRYRLASQDYSELLDRDRRILL